MKLSGILAAAGLLVLSAAGLATTATAQTPAPQDPAAAATAPDLAKGGEVFGARCKMCHSDTGSAPPPSYLATKKPEEIYDILKNGAMAPMASGIPDADLKNIAAFLTTPAAKPAADDHAGAH